MAGTLRVDTHQVASLGEQLGRVRDQMASIGASLDRHEGSVGSSTVVDALRDFETHWGRGRRQIQEKADALAQMLIDSAAAYVDVDDQLNAAMENATTEQVTVGGGGGAAIAV